MIGRTISHYRIAAQLGSGGMGVVYRAEDLRLGREVALKFVSDDLTHDGQAVRRLRSEARAASALNHANICTIYDIDEADGHPFIVMELMKGRSLRDALAAGHLKIHLIVDIGIETADALQAAHSQGIVHRDIKPGNIFLTERGHVKILDFGLAKLTGHAGDAGSTVSTEDNTIAGITLGTVHYMSPEQASGEELDGRTDLFSLGVVLYECATGRHPFPGKTSAVILEAILNRAPLAPVTLNPELPIRLQDVINNCLEKDRELRYQSAADLRADLKRVRRDLESGHSQAMQAVPRGPAHTAGRVTAARSQPVADTGTGAAPRQARRTRVAAAVVVAAAVLGLASYVLWRRAPAPPPQDTSRTAAPSDAALQGRLALASSSLEARSYRAALTYAMEVLALDPNQAAATKIRDQARSMLDRFDAAVADARQHLADGDVPAAARSLDSARAIDPTAPDVTELSRRLAEQGRRRDAGVPPAPKSRASAQAPSAISRPEPSAPGAASSARNEPASPPAAAPPPPKTQSPNVPSEPPPPAATPAPVPPAQPEPAPPKPSPPPSTAAERHDPVSSPAAPPAEDEDAAIRKVVAAYARAIETKDVALFRSIKPNLSGEEERRLQAGFRAVTTQRVTLTILSIQPRGDQASVVLRRRDTIEVDRRQQTADSQQTLTLARARGGWVIVDIR